MGFFREGWRELGRKWERNKLRGQLRRQEAERRQALARLRPPAPQGEGGPSGLPAPPPPLAAPPREPRASDPPAPSKSPDTERAGLEETRRAEAARFDGERRAVEEKKRPGDNALGAARQRQADQERTA